MSLNERSVWQAGEWYDLSRHCALRRKGRSFSCKWQIKKNKMKNLKKKKFFNLLKSCKNNKKYYSTDKKLKYDVLKKLRHKHLCVRHELCELFAAFSNIQGCATAYEWYYFAIATQLTANKKAQECVLQTCHRNNERKLLTIFGKIREN